MNKYSKNFILYGDIDYYCLLCQEIFRGIPDVEKHIRWENHRKNIKNQTYFPKFRKDFIFKVANKYYCEICNFVTSDIATVTEHISGDTHKAMKSGPKTEIKNFIGQYNSSYVLINKVIINMAQWNSIVDKKCLLCDTNVIFTDEHTKSEDHIIKLIQSETKYEDGRYYRKINGDNYYCFTCKKVFSRLNFEGHWPKCENTDEIEIKKLKEAKSSKNIETATKNISADIEKKLIDTLQEFFYIEETNNFATCKYCSTVVPINFKSMIEHMKNQHDNQQGPKGKTKGSDESSEDEVVYMEVTDHGKRRAELAKYGRTHSIKMNFNGSRGWCLICDKYLSAHKNIFKQHTKGSIHRSHLELQGLKKAKKRICKKYRTKSILECNLQYENNEKAFWVDTDCCIDVLSFFLLRQIQNDPHFKKTKCYACNELFLQGQERDHCVTLKHKNNFIAAKVLVLDDEMHDQFFREIRPNLFHCGFCNQTIPFSDEISVHNMTEKHEMLQEKKTVHYFMDTIELNNKTDDLYMELVHYGFNNN